MGNKTWNSQNVISIFWFAQMDYSIPKSYTNSTNTSNLNLPFLSRFTFWTGWVYKLTYTQQFRLPNFIGQFLKFCNLFTISSNKVQRSSICGNCSQKFGFWNTGGGSFISSKNYILLWVFAHHKYLVTSAISCAISNSILHVARRYSASSLDV